jgi:hypothetical protein
MLLSRENYQKGFLIDEELMAGVSQDSEQPGLFFAFVLQQATGEYLGYRAFSDLDMALSSINQIPRSWVFESSSGCGDEACSKAEGKGCSGSRCRSSAKTDACPR